MMRLGAVGAALLFCASAAFAQGNMNMDESVHKIANGGVHAKGWNGVVDASAAKAGQTINDAMIESKGKDDLHIMTGPATTYWKTDKKATGSYTVSAKFSEPQYMNLNDHPHPYGIVVGGNDLGTDNGSYLYCAAYGNGTFIVRGMGPAPFQMGGRRAQANDAIHKAAGKGQPVDQKIAIAVSPDKVDCIINDVTVASYPKSDVVAAGKLKNTDGYVGVRAAHNTEVMVRDFKVEKK